MGDKPNKNLGQHWLKDRAVLTKIAAYAKIEKDTVLEIGPGPGFLTSVLLENAAKVVAVEFDRELATNLASSVLAKLEVVNADFLQFDLSTLPRGYKVVANIPYYITNKIIMKLLTAENKPTVAVLLVQKEVAERLAAEPGEMSILSVAAQLYSTVTLGEIVPAEMFTPPPKVDSQVVILRPKSHKLRPCKNCKKDYKDRAYKDIDEKQFFRVVKAGFSARRKKLRSSLAGGLNISKPDAEKLLERASIDPNLRAQDLSLGDWHNLVKQSKISL
jgi:16S rRNA (adenine1518-N6/adenine1519-N6)-dimethyltransferase